MNYFTIGAMVGVFIPLPVTFDLQQRLGEEKMPTDVSKFIIVMVLSILFWPFLLVIVLDTVSRR